METVVLVSGFLGPNGSELRKKYWGAASTSAKDKYSLVFPKVSPLGSAHDRACEIFAYLRGCQVNYGKEHAFNCKHMQFGEDFSGKGAFAGWSENNPVHLIGHSFGGNTARMLVYLLSIDFFEVGSTTKWVKSVVTISSPLQGSLLTYALGAIEDEKSTSPVRRFSVGYNLGLGAHFLTLLSSVGVGVDVGLERFGVKEVGWRGFYQALFGGRNGGGTPSVCERDNAANDMTVTQAKAHNKDYRSNVDTSSLFEFHFVASSRVIGTFSFAESYRKHFGNEAVSSSMYSMLLCGRDFATNLLARTTKAQARPKVLKEVVFYDNDTELEGHLGETDGLCSTFSQFIARHDSEDTEQFLLSFDNEKFRQMDFIPGSYRVDLPEHTHLSVVPFPDDFGTQETFFDTLFSVLKRLP